MFGFGKDDTNALTMNQPHPDSLLDTGVQGVISKPLDRVDGPKKVTGTATYAAEYAIENCAHGVLVTAVSVPAFSQALKVVRRKGTSSLVGLPPGEFPTPIFDVVLKRITIRGSIVGTRKDLAEALQFAADGRVKAHIHRTTLDKINDVFADMKRGNVDGRMVLDIGRPG